MEVCVGKTKKKTKQANMKRSDDEREREKNEKKEMKAGESKR